MRNYSVTVRWDHKGARYACTQSVRVKATTPQAAINKGLRAVKAKHPGSVRECIGSVVDISVEALGEVLQ